LKIALALVPHCGLSACIIVFQADNLLSYVLCVEHLQFT